MNDVFDQVIHLGRNEKKVNYIESKNAIFIDDSYGERYDVKNKLGINVFDVNNIECLLEE